MIKKLAFIFFVLLTATIKAEYLRPSLSELVLKSDKILYGEIVCVDENLIEVSVYKSINHASKSITLIKFQEWNCGKRWLEYTVGETSLFFLEDKNGQYHTMGGGNEGELPMLNEKIYVHASTISASGYLDNFNRSDQQKEDDGYNNPYNGYMLDLNHFWHAITFIKKCFKAEVNKTGKLVNIQQHCNTTDYESTMEQNKILNWALTELKS